MVVPPSGSTILPDLLPPLSVFEGNGKTGEARPCSLERSCQINNVQHLSPRRQNIGCNGARRREIWILLARRIKASYEDVELSLNYVTARAIFSQKPLRIAFLLASAPYRTLKFHASVIEHGGKALIFSTAPHGYEHHSRLWLKMCRDAPLLNDDEPIVRIMDNDEVLVFGAPWSGSTPCYRNVSAAKRWLSCSWSSMAKNILIGPLGVEAYAQLFVTPASPDEGHRGRNVGSIHSAG